MILCKSLLIVHAFIIIGMMLCYFTVNLAKKKIKFVILDVNLIFHNHMKICSKSVYINISETPNWTAQFNKEFREGSDEVAIQTFRYDTTVEVSVFTR